MRMKTQNTSLNYHLFTKDCYKTLFVRRENAKTQHFINLHKKSSCKILKVMFFSVSSLCFACFMCFFLCGFYLHLFYANAIHICLECQINAQFWHVFGGAIYQLICDDIAYLSNFFNFCGMQKARWNLKILEEFNNKYFFFNSVR